MRTRTIRFSRGLGRFLRSRRCQHQLNKAIIEALEARTLLSVANLVGTSANDTFAINYNSTTGNYEFSGTSNTIAPIAADQLAGFTVSGGGGTDELDITNADLQGADPAVLLNDPGADGTTLNIQVDGNLQFAAQTTHIGQLTISSGSYAAIQPSGTRLLVADQLNLADAGQLYTLE